MWTATCKREAKCQMNGITITLAIGGAVALAIFAYRIGQRMQPSVRDLKPYFRRLGQVAPADPCPCGNRRKQVAPYVECCRPRDVKLLEQQVREFVWTYWSKRTGGRSQARSMTLRLKDFPMPELTIPDRKSVV